MKKAPLFLCLLLCTLFSTIFFVNPTGAPPLSEGWQTRYNYVVDHGNGTKSMRSYVAPQVFWSGVDWQELQFVDEYETLGRYILRNSHITALIYDHYTVFYDPDYQVLCVEDERFEVERWRPQGQGRWDSLGAQSGTPSYSIIQNETSVSLSRAWNSWAGVLNITHYVKKGAMLKHSISWHSFLTEETVFQLKMELSGITSNLCRNSQGFHVIEEETVLISPFFEFGEDNNNLVFTEHLYRLGEWNETRHWNPTTLTNVLLDVHPQGSKMNIYIGNYSLNYGETFYIDPDSSSWQVGASSDDASKWSTFSLTGNTMELGSTAYSDVKHGMRWMRKNVPKYHSNLEDILGINYVLYFDEKRNKFANPSKIS